MPHSFPSPAPPCADDTGLPWDVTVEDAVAAIAEARSRQGDTFAVHSGRDHYLFTFSPAGVESFYSLPEEKASKGVADYLMLRRKLPDEIFNGRRILPNSLFRRDDVASYLVNLDRALDRPWPNWDRKAPLTFSTSPGGSATGWVWPPGRDQVRRRAMPSNVWFGRSTSWTARTRSCTPTRWRRSRRRTSGPSGRRWMTSWRWSNPRFAEWIPATWPTRALFGRIVEAWAPESPAVRVRGIVLDVALIHIASMSNLMAALGWALVDLLGHPSELERVAAGDKDLARRCALESTRMAQRSIMSRAVLAPVSFDTGDVTNDVPAGWTIATLLPC